MLNALYTTEWNWYFNFFIPSFKLIDKVRDGSKIIKKHDQPKTPYQRVLASQDVPKTTKSRLKEEFKELNPSELQRKMSQKIKAIIKKVNTN